MSRQTSVPPTVVAAGLQLVESRSGSAAGSLSRHPSLPPPLSRQPSLPPTPSREPSLPSTSFRQASLAPPPSRQPSLPLPSSRQPSQPPPLSMERLSLLPTSMEDSSPGSLSAGARSPLVMRRTPSLSAESHGLSSRTPMSGVGGHGAPRMEFVNAEAGPSRLPAELSPQLPRTPLFFPDIEEDLQSKAYSSPRRISSRALSKRSSDSSHQRPSPYARPLSHRSSGLMRRQEESVGDFVSKSYSLQYLY